MKLINFIFCGPKLGIIDLGTNLKVISVRIKVNKKIKNMFPSIFIIKIYS